MRDPGFISDAAWNQEAPYGDFLDYDVEQDERWDHVAGSDFFPTRPDRVRTRGVVPGPTVRRATSSQDAGSAPFAAGVHPFS